VDELYTSATEFGASVLVARVSRYVCDLNRSERDVDAEAVQGVSAVGTHPHGLIWRRSTDGQVALAAPLSPAEYERRLERFHRPYHQALSALIEDKRRRFGFALVLAAHSMPGSARVGHQDLGRRADIVPGSRGRTSAASGLIDIPERLAEARGWSVAHDQPYRGGFTTGHYGRPDQNVHVLQVELNRQLYMDEGTLARLPGRFEQTKAYCDELVQEMSRFVPGTARSMAGPLA
jgi:N-formylglutamate amidohydrolase